MTTTTRNRRTPEAAEEPAREVTASPAGGSGDLDPAELKAVAEEINREFPLVLERSGLVLYDVDPAHLQAQWQLSPDDLARARNSFPAHSSGVGVLLRLRRLSAGGGAREVASLRRTAGAAGLQGHALFEVEAGDAVYQAELGLASEDGGWLLMVRSNRVRTPRPLRAPVPPPTAERDVGMRANRGLAGEGRGAAGPDEPVSGPLAPRDEGRPPVLDQPGDMGDASVEPALAAAGPPLEPVFPMPLRVAPVPPAPLSGRKGAYAWDETSGARGEERPTALRAPFASEAAGSWADLPPPLLPPARPGNGGAPFYDPRGALSSRELSGARAAPTDVELHAEVRVWGRASPGSLIDAFGLKLRVGPDGHFSLRRPLGDPELVSRALASSEPSGETDNE